MFLLGKANFLLGKVVFLDETTLPSKKNDLAQLQPDPGALRVLLCFEDLRSPRQGPKGILCLKIYSPRKSPMFSTIPAFGDHRRLLVCLKRAPSLGAGVHGASQGA